MVAQRKRKQADRRRKRDDGSAGVAAGVGTVQELTAQLGVRVREGVRTIREQAAHQAGELAHAVRDEAGRWVDQQKEWAAGRVTNVGDAAHKAARVLRAANIDHLAGYVEGAAAGADEVSQYLGENDLAQMIDDAGELARRYPAVFAAGMFALGLAVGRFARAGQESQEDQSATAEAGTRRGVAGGGRDGVGVRGRRRKSRGVRASRNPA
jgi:hypothetical protein